MYSAAYGTVYYKEPLKSFEVRVGHSPVTGLPSCTESDVKQYSLTESHISHGRIQGPKKGV